MRTAAIVILSALLSLGLVADVLNGLVRAREPLGCKDRGDTKAYMARLPGEPHSMEGCVYFRAFGDPAWVPILGEPTIAGLGVKGKPGLEQQLQWVRIECRKLAKQIKQRC